MASATVTSKGQITLPASLRQALDIQAGDEVVFFTTLDGRPSYRIRHKAHRMLPAPKPWTGEPVSADAMDASIRNASRRRLGVGGQDR